MMESAYELWPIVALALTGIVSGWINVMAGGGSLLTLPIMIFMGIPAPVANGTNRIGIITQNMAAVYGFRRKGFSDFTLSLTLSFCATLGAVLGAHYGTKLEGKTFNYVLAVIMVAVMLITAFGGEKKIDHHPGKVKRIWLGHLLMLFAGCWGGFIQVGVGFILMPILNRVMGVDLVRTNMHKVFIALSYSVFALFIFARKTGVLWIPGLALATGTMIGGYLGAYFSVSKGEKWIKAVLYLMLTVFIAKLIFF